MSDHRFLTCGSKQKTRLVARQRSMFLSPLSPVLIAASCSTNLGQRRVKHGDSKLRTGDTTDLEPRECHWQWVLRARRGTCGRCLRLAWTPGYSSRISVHEI